MGRAGGLAATWSAPPPMMAPPQAHAHNFVKAILTDMLRTLIEPSVPGRRFLPATEKEIPRGVTPKKIVGQGC